jgi:DNA-binding CsgD family transcriptional regulator
MISQRGSAALFYFIFVLLVAALMSSAAAFILLVLQWRRSRDAASSTAIKIELCLALVLVSNFIGFLMESIGPAPDPRILFMLMSAANIALSASAWQAVRITSLLLGGERSARGDAACLIGVAVVYVASVYFSLFFRMEAGMRYDNRVGFMIPSIASALVGFGCAFAFLRFSARITEKWRRVARLSVYIFISISALSIANELFPLARLLGLAQLPLSPFLMIAMNCLIIALVWRGLDEGRSDATEAESPGILFDEKSVDEAARHLAARFELSNREREIAVLVLAGCLNTAIAARLFISVFTVKNHIHSIFRKTGAESRIDLMRIASMAQKDNSN